MTNTIRAKDGDQMTNASFSGKTALISGGASGIGLATAQRLISQGATVWIADIQDTLGQQIAEEIGANYLHLDVAKEEEWTSAVELIAGQGQGLHLLMNNAGIAIGGTLETQTTAEFLQTININLLGVFLGCKVCAPLLALSGGGSIVNVSSIWGMVSDPGAVAYSASKGGVRTMTKAIALDLADRKTQIRANSIHPGFTATPMVVGSMGEMEPEEAAQFAARTIERVPLGLAEADQIAAAAVFLFSDDSSFMTGSELVIDGGFTAA